MSNILNKYLKEYFGFEKFRDGQEEIISSVMNFNDTLVVMPTGGGKSLCYQLPALLQQGTALVISPLIALMKDQVDNLTRKNIPSTFINSTLSYEEMTKRIDETIEGKYKLVYIAPERLESKSFINYLNQIKVSFLAVDEAHCISEWGHDFRPSYLKIVDIKNVLPDITTIALTATATPEVQEDIIYNLTMVNTKKFIKGFDRPNLSYITIKTHDKISKIVDILTETKNGSNIIYAATRKKAESIALGLKEMGIDVLLYHAGLNDNFRKYTQERFINGEVKTIVATNAFGMGIDKEDVRNVIHVDFTQTLEAYYQEAGRAGRDGKTSKCYLLFNSKDRKVQEFFINTSYPEKRTIELVYNYLYDIKNIDIGQKCYEAIPIDVNTIANELNLPIASIKSILKLFIRNKIIAYTNELKTGKIKITTTQERIREFYNNISLKEKECLEALLRGLPSNSFDDYVYFDSEYLIQKYFLNVNDFDRLIRKMIDLNLIDLQIPEQNPAFYLAKDRTDIDNLPIDFDELKERKNYAIKKLNLVQQYAETLDCKRNFILNYFGDNSVNGNCGKCSACLIPSGNKVDLQNRSYFLEKSILSACLELNNSFGKTNIIDYLKGKSNQTIKKHNLHRGKLFGACRDFTIEEIKMGIEKAIYENKLFSSNGRYPTLSVNPEIYGEINGVSPLYLNFNNGRYNELKDLRKKLAYKFRVPENSIISSKTLKLISTIKPKNLLELSKIEGVNHDFISKFGEYFLNPELINERVSHLSETQKKIIKILRLNKISFIDLQKLLGIEQQELAVLIQDILLNGESLNIEHWFEDDDIKTVSNILKTKPHIQLRQLRAKYDFKYSYPELRVLLGYCRMMLMN